MATNLGFDGSASAVTMPPAFDPVAPTLPPPTITVSSPGRRLTNVDGLYS